MVEVACRLHSACLLLKLVPAAWRQQVIAPVPKSAARIATVADMRPIKLLEATMKIVNGMVKERLRVAVELAGLLDEAQHGFRAAHDTYSAAISVVALYEQAERNHTDVWGMMWDIMGAYDTVERGVGIGLALRRMGVGEDVIEWFMECNRHNINRVRSGWEQLNEREGRAQETFEAVRGFTQGATESPLLWIVFYDMVLSQLRKEGVGKSVERSTDGGTPGAGGLSAFADDTFFAENTAELAQRSARVFEETLGLVSLKVAARKSLVMATAWDRQRRGGTAAAGGSWWDWR